MLRRKFLSLVFFIVCISALSLLTIGACGNSGNGNMVIEKDSPNFYAIVSKITGETVTPSNVPIYFTIGSDGSYCTIDTNPNNIDDYYSETAHDYVKEMNAELGLPDYVFQEMITTSYLQGKQTETIGNIEVVWYYHPDMGLNVTYKILAN